MKTGSKKGFKISKTKKCSSCKKFKETSEYHLHSKTHDGLQTLCKDCNCENTRNRPSEYWRKQNLKRNFGITVEQYNELLDKQDHSCAICLKHESSFNKKLAVDHDHHTREIRGLLCTACNYHLIRRHRDGEVLRRMADYVEQGTGWFVPKKKRPAKRKPK